VSAYLKSASGLCKQKECFFYSVFIFFGSFISKGFLLSSFKFGIFVEIPARPVKAIGFKLGTHIIWCMVYLNQKILKIFIHSKITHEYIWMTTCSYSCNQWALAQSADRLSAQMFHKKGALCP